MQVVGDAARSDPAAGLAGDCGDVFEAGGAVQDRGTVVLGDSGGDKVDDACRTVVPAAGHLQAYFSGPISNVLGDRQEAEIYRATLGNRLHARERDSRIVSLQLNGDARGGGAFAHACLQSDDHLGHRVPRHRRASMSHRLIDGHRP